MAQPLVITIPAYSRPEYLVRTVSALAKCRGINECRVVVLLDKHESSGRQADIVIQHGFGVVAHSKRLGPCMATHAALSMAFDQLQAEYAVHLEDDVVPCVDAVEYFVWARDQFRDDRSVMTVSGYNKIPNGTLEEVGARRWFTPWGWATWADRWREIKACWKCPRSMAWDEYLNKAIRGRLFEVYPEISRVQNIGATGGANATDPQWHYDNQRAHATSDDVIFGSTDGADACVTTRGSKYRLVVTGDE